MLLGSVVLVLPALGVFLGLADVACSSCSETGFFLLLLKYRNAKMIANKRGAIRNGVEREGEGREVM